MKQELLKKLEHKNLNEIESFLPGNDYIRGYCGNINGYYTKVDPSKLGHALRALITVRAFMGRLKPFLHKIKRHFSKVQKIFITYHLIYIFIVYFQMVQCGLQSE